MTSPQRPAERPGTVLAAGAICWRPGPRGGLELLMVRSARWNEWSWPKGKIEPREPLPLCAVREVGEETGAVVELGLRLPSVSYVLPDGRDKTVAYWAGRVREMRDPTAGDDEIADVAWLPVPEALDRLSRPGDLAPVDALLGLAESGGHDTAPLLFVRHAKAVGRAAWGGTEADRPLTDSGRRQAATLAGLLSAWRPARILSSPWARCMQTLQPYLDARGVAGPEVLPLLSEDGLEHDGTRIDATVTALVDGGEPALVCTHRPVLGAVVPALARASTTAVRDDYPHRDPWLSPAEILVAHVAATSGRGRPRRVTAVERHLARPARNRQQGTGTPG